MSDIDIISLIKEDKNGNVKYRDVKNLYFRFGLITVLFIISLPIMGIAYNEGASSFWWIIEIDLAALLFVLVCMYHRINKNKKLKNKYPQAFTKLANIYGVKFKPNGEPPIASIYYFAKWDELTYSCIEELESHKADSSYPLSPLSYNKYFGRDTEYSNNHRKTSDFIINIGKGCGVISIICIIVLSIAGWIESGKIIIGIGILFGLTLVLFLLYFLLRKAIEAFVRMRFENNPTIMSSIATMEGINPEKIWDSYNGLNDKELLYLLIVNKDLFTAPLLIIKPFRDKYVSLLEKYPNGIQVYLYYLSECRQYRNTLVTEKEKNGQKTTKVLEARELLCNLLDSNTFRITIQVLNSENDIRVYEANYAIAHADDIFIDFTNRAYDEAIKSYSERMPEWNLEVSKINYRRLNYDGSQGDVELRLIDIYYTDRDSEISFTDYQQRIETTKKLLLGQLEYRIAAFCDSITGFHTIVFNDDKKHEDGHLQIGKMIVTTLKKYEPKIRPYLMLNNIEELDDVLTKHSKNVIFNIDHYLQDESSEILQSVIQNRSYVIGIHYKNRHKKNQTCQIKPNVSNSIDCLNGHLPYLFLYSYIPVWHENDNNFQLTKEEFDYRQKILLFKGAGYDKRVGNETDYDDLKLLLNESFDGLENVMFFFVPSKQSFHYKSRHKNLNEFLVRDFHATTSYKLVEFLMDGQSSRDGGCGRPAQLYWGDCFFKGKQVILFDDIITSGHTMLHYKRMLEEWGAKVIACVALGKTHYSHVPHPIDELKAKVLQFQH